jgi:uncharacterized protein YcsI (UPF0317 family)
MFRAEEYCGPTAALCPGAVQANLVVIPSAQAEAFAAYCRENAKACPLLERLPPGDPEPQQLAPGADLRFDLPLYRRFAADGSSVDVTNIADAWTDDCSAFLLGCSFTFEDALSQAGIVPRHVEEGVNVPMYRTSIATQGVPPFAGPLVVSMRPVREELVRTAYEATAPFERVHGAPVHHGDASALGIVELGVPQWGSAVTIHPGEVPVFWACGVTSQEAVLGAIAAGGLPWAITHAPGHMFVSDVRVDALRTL